jgi:hypothetical protein
VNVLFVRLASSDNPIPFPHLGSHRWVKVQGTQCIPVMVRCIDKYLADMRRVIAAVDLLFILQSAFLKLTTPSLPRAVSSKVPPSSMERCLHQCSRNEQMSGCRVYLENAYVLQPPPTPAFTRKIGLPNHRAFLPLALAVIEPINEHPKIILYYLASNAESKFATFFKMSNTDAFEFAAGWRRATGS